MTDAIRPLPTAEQLALKALSTRRRQLTEMIAMEKTRLKQTAEPLLLASHRATIAALTVQCRHIEAELARRIAAKPQPAWNFEILPRSQGSTSEFVTDREHLTPDADQHETVVTNRYSTFATGLCDLNSRPFSTTSTTASAASVQRKKPVENGSSVPS